MEWMKRLGCKDGFSMIQMVHPMEAGLIYEVSSTGCAAEAKGDVEMRALTPVGVKTLKQYLDVAMSPEARILIGEFHQSDDGKARFRVLSNTQLSKMSSEAIEGLQVLIRESTTEAALDLVDMEERLNGRYGEGARFVQLQANKQHSMRAQWAITYRIYDLKTSALSAEELVTAYMLARAMNVEIYDYSHGRFKMSLHDDLVARRKCRAAKKQEEMEQLDLKRRLGIASM